MEYKGTKGVMKVSSLPDGFTTIVVYRLGSSLPVARIFESQSHGVTREEAEANAQTIADGLNLAQKYGSLKELERLYMDSISKLSELVAFCRFHGYNISTEINDAVAAIHEHNQIHP